MLREEWDLGSSQGTYIADAYNVFMLVRYDEAGSSPCFNMLSDFTFRRHSATFSLSRFERRRLFRVASRDRTIVT